MESTTEPRSQSVPGGEPGALARIVGVFFSPGKTFESIARRPGWVFPVVFILAWTLVAGFILTSRFDVDAMVSKQAEAMERRGQTMPPDQQEGARKVTEMIVKFSPLIGVCFVGVTLFLVPLLYHGLSAIGGKKGHYTAVVSAYAHAQMVAVVKGILLVAVAFPKASIDPEALGTLLKSNVAALLDPESLSAPVRVLLTNIDVFDLWALGLCVVGLTRVTRLRTGGAAMIVFGVWAAYVLISMAFATLGAAFGG